MKTLGKMATALLLITAGFVHADAGRLAVSTPEGNMRQLFAVNEVDCHHVKGYLAQQTCFAEQQKWRAEQQTTIVQNDFTCERYHPSPQDHLHITVQDAVQKPPMSTLICILLSKKTAARRNCPPYLLAIRCLTPLPHLWPMAAPDALVTANGWKPKNGWQAARVTVCA